VSASGRIAVGVSGTGSNLRALRAAERRGVLGGTIGLVFADRPCPAIAFADAEGLATAVLGPGDHDDRAAWDEALTAALVEAGTDLVVLAGFMRLLGPRALSSFHRRILNVHPSLLPAFPGRDAIGDALAAGVRVTGVTVHIVDETLDGGPIVGQEAVPVSASDDRAALTERIHAVEHRLLPRCVALALAGGITIEGRTVSIDRQVAAALRLPRRALISVSDKRDLAGLGRGLADLGFELVSTGGTARALRAAGLDVTDVSAVTGFPEMLDGRVKTLHPRIAAGVLADLRLAEHRAQLAASAIDPFEIVVVNLYPFAEASQREGITADELIEEIDIGGPTLVRAAAKNHASVAVVTDPVDYPRLLDALRQDGTVPGGIRRELAVRAFAHTAAYDRTIADVLPGRLRTAPPAVDGPVRDTHPAGGSFPKVLDIRAERVQVLRYGENPHQSAALYRMASADEGAGPFAAGAELIAGKALSYNNILDASAVAALARDLRGTACVVVKHTNPCGAAETDDDLVAAWEAALAGDPVSAFGGVVAVRGVVDARLALRLTDLFLEVIVAAGFDEEARAALAAKPDLRMVVDPGICRPPVAAVELRSAGGALLAMDADTAPEDPGEWRVATSRQPTAAERRDLDLAWRVARHVKSNGIVLARDRAVVGVGAGQMSRVDSARLAVEKAGEARAVGAVCASDAFFPFPDAVERCLEAGVGAFVQPGGSKRDAEVVAAAERAGATMLMTGRRHFRH
jgi:phosphoribosylaminoimidazolecarboxamide formyltransferase/IMP cyclohydrolase